MIYYRIPAVDPNWLNIVRQQVAHQKYGILLESCHSQSESEPEHQDNYSIFAFDPDCFVQLKNNELTSENLNIPQKYRNQPFELLKYILNSYPEQNSSQLPFEGGLMGFMGYELGMSMMDVPIQQPDDINLPEIGIGFYSLALIYHVQENILYITGIENQSSAALKLRNWLDNLNPLKIEPFHLLQPWQSNMTESEYHEKFSRIADYIKKGDCYQVNLAQRWYSTYRGDNWDAYEKLSIENKAPFSAYMSLDHHNILSISPERFIHCQHNLCQSKPIKGTRSRSSDINTDLSLIDELSDSAKDRAENVMIVDLLRNDFGRVCHPGSIKVPHLFKIESFPAVHHLVSTVTGKLLKSKSALDLLKVCFPGGSITGAPKKRSMEIIQELEPHRRHTYCGSLLYLGCNGKMDSNIAIRTLICSGDNIWCWAGGGLVADSDVNEEYQETLTKVDKILPILNAL